ncbi:MAG: hypothetical protein Q7T25_00355 [Sideroxyarcus sp.]|nr:hypothetical protein [Sideroxyarcus sp.]
MQPSDSIALQEQGMSALNVVQRSCQALFEYANGAAIEVGNGMPGPTSLTRMELRAQILAMEAAVIAGAAAGEVETVDLDATLTLRHIFAPGAYAREMSIPAGHWAFGKIHKHAHLSFITKGRIAVLTEDGPNVITAPYTFVNTPGTKRFVFALEDTIWSTVHVTEETDLSKIEEHVIAKSYDELPTIEAENSQEKLP